MKVARLKMGETKREREEREREQDEKEREEVQYFPIFRFAGQKQTLQRRRASS